MPLEAKTNVVYQLSCEICGNFFIGEMKKKVCEKVNKHVAAVRNVNLVLKHCNENNHCINFNNPQIFIQLAQYIHVYS